MTGFWILAGLAAFVTMAFLARAALAGRGATAAATAAYDVQVYRDQLRELDRDVARGVIGAEEAERARVEISRRLLEADRKAQSGEAAAEAPRAATLAALALSAALVVGGGLWVYADLGAPGYWDMPLKGRIAAAEEARASRPSQAEAEAELPEWPGPPAEAPADYLDLVAQLRAAVAQRPDELEGQMLLATHEAALGNFRAAHAAMAEAIRLKGAAATAEDYAQYVDLLALAAQGYVSPEAEAAIDAALARNANDSVARYYAGLLYAQTGRPDVAFRFWRDLLEKSDPSEPWVAPILGQIQQLAQMAGVDYTPPALAPTVSGPTAADIAAAEDMTPEERADMVNAMVSRLMERLATQGGPAADWARLIGALGVQGDTERAAVIWGEARGVFAGRPDDLATIDAAAAQAGLAAPAPAAPQAQGAMPGPSADDIAAAQDMTPAEQAEMVNAMVQRLLDRLATEGGPPGDWARAISVLGVQGDRERAGAIWAEARGRFAADPAALAALDAAAAGAGLGAPPDPEAPAAVPDAEAPAADPARAAQLDGLATRLSDELASAGGPPEKWIELLATLGELGEPARAATVWAEAQKVFAGDPAALQAIREAATAAGALE